MSEQKYFSDKELFENSKTGDFLRFIEELKAKAKDMEEDETRPLLSVLMRTQGKRLETLKEVFLCLSSQSCMDFEVLLMGHKVCEDDRKKVEEVISACTQNIKDRIRYIPVDFGGRTAPLNEGYRHAKGMYITILDDDDIVFENWVESFKNAHEKGAGRVLHSYVMRQDWASNTDEDGNVSLAAMGPMQNLYCRDFDWIRQISVNSCPSFSYAIPRYVLSVLGFEFDESLTTTEDWDFLMRVTALCGISEVDDVTGIYRIWINAENSATVHDQTEWMDNYKIVQQRIVEMPCIMTDKDIRKVLEYKKVYGDEGVYCDGSDAMLDVMTTAKLYIDEGHGYSEYNIIPGIITINKNTFSAVYEKDFDKAGKIKALRFDPSERNRMFIEDIKIKIYFEEGESKVWKMDELKTNGEAVRGGLLMFSDDPQLRIEFPQARKIEKVEISGKANANISDRDIISLIHGGKIEKRSKIEAFLIKVKNRIG